MAHHNTAPTQRPYGFSIYTFFLFAFLALALYLGYAVIEPFLHTIVLSTVLAVIFSPLYHRIHRLCGERENLSAALTTVVILFALVIPVLIFVFGLVDQGVNVISDVNAWIKQGGMETLFKSGNLDQYLAWINEKIPFFDLTSTEIRNRFLEFSKTVGQELFGLGTGLVRNTATLVIHFLLLFFMVFYFLRDGRRMTSRLLYLVPLRRAQKYAIVENLVRVSRSVLLGSLLVASLQGLAGGIGLAIIGVPALFWGTMMGFTSLIPVVGSSVIWIPAAIYLAVFASWKSALFLVLWALLVVSSIDTFLRPYFLRGAARVSTFYTFLSILGGLNAFGPLGILYGPLVLSFVITMLRIYGDEYFEQLDENGGTPEAECQPATATSEPSSENPKEPVDPGREE